MTANAIALSRGNVITSITVDEIERAADRRCRAEHAGRYGKSAAHPNGPCGECLYVAREADAAIAAEFDLPAEIEPAPNYVDTVAVERATAGGKVTLTPAELVEAVYLMRGDDLEPAAMARRLHLPEIAVEALDLVLGVVEAIAAPLTNPIRTAPALSIAPAEVAAA